MGLDGCLTDDERIGDLAVREPAGEEAQDLRLALRERLDRRRPPVAAVSVEQGESVVDGKALMWGELNRHG